MEQDLQWAWFAGLFEGEGCISLTGKNSVRLSVHSTDRDVIEHCLRATGVGRIGSPRQLATPPTAKAQYPWMTDKASEVQMVLERIHPYLHQRRRSRADEALERLRGCRQEGYCKRGHPLSGPEADVYMDKKGRPFCRVCARIRSRKIKT